MINLSLPSERSTSVQEIRNPIHNAPLSPRKIFHSLLNKPRLKKRKIKITSDRSKNMNAGSPIRKLIMERQKKDIRERDIDDENELEEEDDR